MEDRIKQIIEYYRLNPYALEQKILVSEGTISKFLAGKIGMKVGTITKILELFPDISADWLLFGKGEMLRSGSPKPASSTPADNDLVLKILAEKDRRIEQLILEKHELEQRLDTVLRVSADIQSVTPPQSAGTQIDTASNA